MMCFMPFADPLTRSAKGSVFCWSPRRTRLSGTKVKEISNNSNVAVWVESDGAASQTVDARLVDLAEDGFKLALAESLALDGKGRQRLCVREQGVDFRIDGILCSERQITKQVNNLECSFSPPIPSHCSPLSPRAVSRSQAAIPVSLQAPERASLGIWMDPPTGWQSTTSRRTVSASGRIRLENWAND